LLTILILAVPFSSSIAGIDLNSYDMFIKYVPDDGKLNLEMVIDLTRTDDIEEIELNFTTQSTMADVQTMVDGNWTGIPFKIDDRGKLFAGTHPDQAGESEIKIRLVYSFLIGQIEDKFVLYNGHRWFPQIDNSPARVKMRIEVPDDYIVLSIGNLVEEIGHENTFEYVWDSGFPTIKVPLVIARDGYFFQETENTAVGEVYFYCEMKNRDEAGDVIVEAADALEYFSDIIGPLPYDRITLMEISDLQGADINSWLIFF